MSHSFFAFLQQLGETPALALFTLLTLGVLLVNGWTDAPNAIAGAVVTGALPFRRAVILAAVCNFAGVCCVTAVNASVAETVYSIAAFSGGPRAASIALSAGMAGVVVWAVVCWRWGIPTSESHALVAGITGAAVALEGSWSCVHWESWGKVLLGLLLSTAAGFWCGRQMGRRAGTWRGSDRLFRGLQLPGAAATAFFHGAQDGQKFLGVFLLGTALVQGRQDEQTFVVPLWLLVFCAVGMALGTGMGGRRIIDTVGREMVTLNPRDGVACDVAAVGCLLVATVLGLPVSTTHTRTAALLGVGCAGGKKADWRVAGTIALAWGLTFPGCAVLGWSMARLFLHIWQ